MMKKNPVLTTPQYSTSLIILFFIAAVSFCAPQSAPYDPNQIDMAHRLEGSSSIHLLGTDTLGRDILSRVIWGGRASILLSIVASSLTMILGIIIGIWAGYQGGPVDSVILIITSMFQGIPGMSLMIALAGALGPGIHSVLISLVIISWPSFSRIVRGEVMKLKAEDYVEGIQSLGGSSLYIVVRHILPNMAGTIIVLFTTRIGFGILASSGLSFLGLGIQPPTPDWGVMIRDAMYYFRVQPFLILAPGGVLFLTSLSINLIGDGLRDRFDTRLQIRRDRF